MVREGKLCTWSPFEFSRADGLGQEDLEKHLSAVTTSSSCAVFAKHCGKLVVWF